MLTRETAPRQIENSVTIDVTRSIWWWLCKKFEDVESRLQKADLLKSALALALLAQLISVIQKELPEDSQVGTLLNQYNQDGYQANLIVRREKPWKAISQNCTRPSRETQYGFFEVGFLVGPKPQADKDPELALIELHIPYSEVIERWSGQFKNPRLTIAIVTDRNRKSIDRPATFEELKIAARLIKKVVDLEKV